MIIMLNLRVFCWTQKGSSLKQDVCIVQLDDLCAGLQSVSVNGAPLREHLELRSSSLQTLDVSLVPEMVGGGNLVSVDCFCFFL